MGFLGGENGGGKSLLDVRRWEVETRGVSRRREILCGFSARGIDSRFDERCPQVS